MSDEGIDIECMVNSLCNEAFGHRGPRRLKRSAERQMLASAVVRAGAACGLYGHPTDQCQFSWGLIRALLRRGIIEAKPPNLWWWSLLDNERAQLLHVWATLSL